MFLDIPRCSKIFLDVLRCSLWSSATSILDGIFVEDNQRITKSHMNKQTYRISTNRLPPPVGWGVEWKFILRAFLKKINSKFWSNVSPQLNAASFRHSCQLSPVSCALGELTDRESISIYYRNHDQTLRWLLRNISAASPISWCRDCHRPWGGLRAINEEGRWSLSVFGFPQLIISPHFAAT